MRTAPLIDESTFRALERHETACHAIPRRTVRDLGDALLLHDPLDADPFWNRLVSLSWPSGRAAFDARLAEAITLFGLLDRRPHIWPSPRHARPSDLVARLRAHGFRDHGGGHLMVLVDPAAAPAPRPGEAGPHVTVALVRTTPDPGGPARAAAEVLVEAFGAAPEALDAIASTVAASLVDPRVALVLVSVDGVPAAVTRVSTFDGFAYLSGIGTRTAFRGRGLAAIAARTAMAHGIASGGKTVYLGVDSGNHVALRLYDRLGFASLGEAPDLILG